MTLDECHALIRRLMAAYGGEWDDDRVALWAELFLPLNYSGALAAVKAMTDAERFPTPAALNDHLNPVVPPGVVAVGDRRFSPGIGWLGEYAGEALELGDGTEAPVISITEAREAIRRAKEKRQ